MTPWHLHPVLLERTSSLKTWISLPEDWVLLRCKEVLRWLSPALFTPPSSGLELTLLVCSRSCLPLRLSPFPWLARVDYCWGPQCAHRLPSPAFAKPAYGLFSMKCAGRADDAAVDVVAQEIGMTRQIKGEIAPSGQKCGIPRHVGICRLIWSLEDMSSPNRLGECFCQYI